MSTHIITITRTTDAGVYVAAVARTVIGEAVDFSEVGIPFHVTVTAVESEEYDLPPTPTTDIRAWLDRLPIGAAITDESVSFTETDSGYWEATKASRGAFLAVNGIVWTAEDLALCGNYRLLDRTNH